MPSWCQAANVGECGSLMKNVLVQTRILGPITSSIASRIFGWRISVVEPGRMRIGVGAPFDVGFGDRRAKFGLQLLQTGEAGRDLRPASGPGSETGSRCGDTKQPAPG